MSSVKIGATENSTSSVDLWLDVLGVRTDRKREEGNGDLVALGERQEELPVMLDVEFDDDCFLSYISVEGNAAGLDAASPTSLHSFGASDSTRSVLPRQHQKHVALPFVASTPAPITTSLDRVLADTTGAAQAVLSQMQASMHDISGGLSQAAQGPSLAVRGIAVSAKG